MTTRDWDMLFIGMGIVFVLLMVVIVAYAWPVSANICHLNGHIIHGNLTIDANHGSNFTVRFTCP